MWHHSQIVAQDRLRWDAAHPKHTVVFREETSDVVVFSLAEDNSEMGCFGPLLTPEAAVALNAARIEYFDSIDGNVPDGWGT